MTSGVDFKFSLQYGIPLIAWFVVGLACFVWPAMRNSGLTWTPETLETFIADPQASVPGNRMPYDGMHDARDRADLIAYLQKAK